MKHLTPVEYGKLACETVMNSYDAVHLPPCHEDDNTALFTYHQGVFLSGMNRIYQKTHEEKLFYYIKEWFEATLDENGEVKTSEAISFKTLDFRMAGILMYPLFERTGDEKYLRFAKKLTESLMKYPTNSLGGFWHMEFMENQMWLDGLYMAGPLIAMYANKFNKPEFLDLAIRQAILMYENMFDEKSGLLVHGWDETKKAQWADPQTGKSGQIWGRAMGWYVTALADILEYVPDNHPKKQMLISIEREMLESVVKYQDKENGRWYQVVNKPGFEGNWHENSCSCLFVYALSKSIRMGYIGKDFIKSAINGYNGVINSLQTGKNGELYIGDVCVGTGIDEGTYEHYINCKTSVNDLHGVGAFVLMCSEYDKIYQSL